MTDETRIPYDAGQPQPEPADLPAIEARLAAASALPFDFEAFCALYGHAPADLRALVDEVRRLRHDDAIWDKHSLVQIVTERDELRGEVERLQSLLETEQRAKWAAEQDKQHWQEEAERLRLQVAQLAEALEVAIE